MVNEYDKVLQLINHPLNILTTILNVINHGFLVFNYMRFINHNLILQFDITIFHFHENILLYLRGVDPCLEI